MQHTLNQYVETGLRTKCLFWSCLSVKISRNWLPLRIPTRAEAKVDKNRAKCLNLFYHPPKKICTKKPQLPRCDFSKLFTFPPSRRRSGRLRHECSRPAGSPKTASSLPLLQVWPNGQLAFFLQLAWPCEHLLQNRRRSSAC